MQDVDPPKLQVVAPANAGVDETLNVVVPVAMKVIGVMLAVTFPAAMLNAPRLGIDARFPLCVSVPVAKPAV